MVVPLRDPEWEWEVNVVPLAEGVGVFWKRLKREGNHRTHVLVLVPDRGEGRTLIRASS